MRIGVFGAGAVGSHLAARLRLAGHDVSLVGRGEHLAAARRHGLVLRSAAFSGRVAVHAAEHADECGPQDILLVAVKTPALRGLGEHVRPMIGSGTLAVFAQNGLPWWYSLGLPPHLPRPPALGLFELWSEFKNVLSADQVVGGIVKASSEIVAPGHVLNNSGSNALLVGYTDDRTDDRIASLRGALAGAGFTSPPVASIRQAVWLKLLRNMSSSALSAATGSTSGAAKSDPHLATVFRRIVTEGMAIAQAAGFPLDGLTGPEIMLDQTGDVVPSLLQDLRLGRRVEVDDLLMAPLRFARELGIETSTSDAVFAVVRRIAAEKRLL